MKCVRPQKLEELARMAPADYAAAFPFPHAVFDDFLEKDAAEAVLAEFSDLSKTPERWKYYHHYNENKRALSDLNDVGPAMRALFAELQSPDFIRFVERVSGLSGLLSDPDLDGGGLHETLPGGFLNMHIDFLSHATRKTWSRQVNLLLFLNKDWDDSYNGSLEFWDSKVTRRAKRIKPIFNRCVVFRTARNTFHGVPDPLACPEGNSRKSIALYYFREESATCRLSSTYYKPRPADSPLKKLLIGLDRSALRFYSYLKRYGGLSDRIAGKILKYF